MSEAFEVSPDDAAGVAEGIRRAAGGSVVHLVREGRTIAEIVPASRRGNATTGSAVDDDCELDAAAMSALEARVANLPEASRVASEVHADRFGAPTMAHYRAVWAKTGVPWPGEAFIRRHHRVADAS